MPTGTDVDELLPVQVGPYRREPIRAPQDLDSEPIYANYVAGNSEVFVELGICGDPAFARSALATAKAETDASVPDLPQVISTDTDPSFLKVAGFMAWTRGGYYFSAHAKGGEDDLDQFMNSFPY